MDEQRKFFDELKERAHWRVNIRPLVYEEYLIKKLSDCLDVLDRSQVRLRGWPYPYIDRSHIYRGQIWIGSGYLPVRHGTFDPEHEEVWRFFQSGQFINYFVCLEDYTTLPWTSSAYPQGRPERYLLITSTLYRLAEIFELASRLVLKEVLYSGARISITWNGLQGRHLVFWNISRHLSDEYIATTDTLTYEREFQAEELVRGPDDGAIDAALWLFERFGWQKPPRSVFVADLRQLRGG